jgi:hypothetical protein
VLVAKAEEIETALESGESVDIVIELPSVAVGGSKDTTAPTVIVSAAASSLTAGGTTTITFTFSEEPVGFTNDDVTVVGGTLSTVTVSSTDAKIYTATFTAASSGSTSGSVTVKAGSYTDAAGNAGSASTAFALAISAVDTSSGSDTSSDTDSSDTTDSDDIEALDDNDFTAGSTDLSGYEMPSTVTVLQTQE